MQNTITFRYLKLDGSYREPIEVDTYTVAEAILNLKYKLGRTLLGEQLVLFLNGKPWVNVNKDIYYLDELETLEEIYLYVNLGFIFINDFNQSDMEALLEESLAIGLDNRLTALNTLKDLEYGKDFTLDDIHLKYLLKLELMDYVKQRYERIIAKLENNIKELEKIKKDKLNKLNQMDRRPST